MRHDDSFDFRPRFDPNRNLLGGSGFESGVSLSGSERNHLFANGGALGFRDLGALAGLDHPADGRAVAWLDYDRDGRLDFAVVNANTPMLQLFRNQLGDRGAPGRVLALDLVGGNTTAGAHPRFGNRDGIGARVEVRVAGRTLHRTLSAGEGFAAQNSRTLLVGLASAERVESVTVRWPAGGETRAEGLAADTRVTLFEDPARPGGAVLSEPYRVPARRTAAGRVPRPGRERLPLPGAGDAALRLFTTMATWCETCRGELPRIAALRAAFPGDQLALHAVAVDPDDTRSKLEAYVEEQGPAYALLLDLAPGDIAAVKQAVVRGLRRDALPASIVTDSDGRILEVSWGVPSVSDVRRLLSARGAGPS